MPTLDDALGVATMPGGASSGSMALQTSSFATLYSLTEAAAVKTWERFFDEGVLRLAEGAGSVATGGGAGSGVKLAWLPHARTGATAAAASSTTSTTTTTKTSTNSRVLRETTTIAKGSEYGVGSSAGAVRWAGAEARELRTALRWLPIAFAHTPDRLHAALIRALDARVDPEIKRWIKAGGTGQTGGK